jgi:hypothetical protein
MTTTPHMNLINALNMEKKAKEEYESAKQELEYMQKEQMEMHLKLWQKTWKESREMGETVEEATKLANAAIEIENNVWKLTEEDQYSVTIGKVQKAKENWEKSKINVIKEKELRDEGIKAIHASGVQPSFYFGCPTGPFGSFPPIVSSTPRTPFTFGSFQPEEPVRLTLSPASQIGIFDSPHKRQSRFGEVGDNSVKRSKYLLVSDMLPSAVDIWAKKHPWNKYAKMSSIKRAIKGIFLAAAEDEHYDKLKISLDVARIAREIRGKDADLLKTSREIVWVLVYKAVVGKLRICLRQVGK